MYVCVCGWLSGGGGVFMSVCVTLCVCVYVCVHVLSATSMFPITPNNIELFAKFVPANYHKQPVGVITPGLVVDSVDVSKAGLMFAGPGHGHLHGGHQPQKHGRDRRCVLKALGRVPDSHQLGERTGRGCWHLSL